MRVRGVWGKGKEGRGRKGRADSRKQKAGTARKQETGNR
jgi:hypothetical protein